MRIVHFAIISALCCCTAAALHCADTTDQANSDASTVVPLPEAQQQYTSATPVDAIVVDKDGNMSERQYTYDPNRGGVVINNYYQVAGPDCSLYFPAFGVGFLWNNGFWVDSQGYYWNGIGFGFVGYGYWNSHWNYYWHHNWNNRWNHYRSSHPHGHWSGHGGHGARNVNRGGMHRPSSHASRGGGGHGGGHGGGGHGGGGRR